METMAGNEKVQTINTTRGELRFYRDWDNFEGGIVMLNAQTIKRYREIQNLHPDADKCGVFFAFSNEQFSDGYRHLVELGHIKDGDKVIQSVGGAFGTKEGLNKFFQFYEDRDKPIREECAPQEIYFYEYNNHESMIAWDGDLEAIKIIIDIWGTDVARRIVRYNASMSVDNIIRKPVKMEGLYFTYKGEKRVPANLWFSDIGNDGQRGLCYSMYDNALHIVLSSDGNPYCNEDLAGLNASYDNVLIYNFHVE